MPDLEALPELAQWPDLQAVLVVATIRAASPGAPITSDYRVYMASLIRSATVGVMMLRQHWDIENTLQWSLDVTFNEDPCRIRQDHAPENVASVRPIALNLLRQEPSQPRSLRQKRFFCGFDEHYLRTVLSGATEDAITLLNNVVADAQLTLDGSNAVRQCEKGRLQNKKIRVRVKY
jgi:hypothetical protein